VTLANRPTLLDALVAIDPVSIAIIGLASRVVDIDRDGYSDSYRPRRMRATDPPFIVMTAPRLLHGRPSSFPPVHTCATVEGELCGDRFREAHLVVLAAEVKLGIVVVVKLRLGTDRMLRSVLTHGKHTGLPHQHHSGVWLPVREEVQEHDESCDAEEQEEQDPHPAPDPATLVLVDIELVELSKCMGLPMNLPVEGSGFRACIFP